MPLPVALYIPNLLGYLRIVLAFAGLRFAVSSDPVAAIVLWIASASLDLFDGLLARALNQTSRLGVFLDIAADNILRTVVWVAAALAAVSSEKTPSSSSYSTTQVAVSCAVICLEWTTMVSTQVYAAQNSQHWKEARGKDPWIIQTFFSNNFRNPLGFLGVYGLFSANMFAYGYNHPVIYENIPAFDIFMNIAFVGRVLSAAIEMWFCISYFSFLVESDKPETQSKRSD